MSDLHHPLPSRRVLDSLLLVKELVHVVLVEGVQVEGRDVHCSHIGSHRQDLHIIDQVAQLPIVAVVIPRDNWDAVLHLIGEAVRSVIYDHHVLKTAVAEDAQVFDVETIGQNAVFSVEPVVNQRPCGVEVIEHYVSVAAVGGGEHDYFEILVGCFQALPRKWSDVDASLRVPYTDQLACGETHWEYNIGGL